MSMKSECTTCKGKPSLVLENAWLKSVCSLTQINDIWTFAQRTWELKKREYFNFRSVNWLRIKCYEGDFLQVGAKSVHTYIFPFWSISDLKKWPKSPFLSHFGAFSVKLCVLMFTIWTLSYITRTADRRLCYITCLQSIDADWGAL